MNRGIIVLTSFPFTDLSSSKRRPAIIISKGKNTEDIIVAYISSKIPSQLLDTDFVIKESSDSFKKPG